MPLDCTSLVLIQFQIKEPKVKQCTCPSSNITFDIINHLMDVILHVLLFMNHHVFFYLVYYLYSSYSGNNHVIILFFTLWPWI